MNMAPCFSQIINKCPLERERKRIRLHNVLTAAQVHLPVPVNFMVQNEAAYTLIPALIACKNGLKLTHISFQWRCSGRWGSTVSKNRSHKVFSSMMEVNFPRTRLSCRHKLFELFVIFLWGSRDDVGTGNTGFCWLELHPNAFSG